MSQQERDGIFEMLTRYAITSNGVALSVSLVALAGIDSHDSVIKVTSTPFWFFFLGMISAGLYIVSRLHFSIGKDATDLKDEISSVKMALDDRQKDIDELTIIAFEGGVLNSKLAERIKQMRESVAEAKKINDNHLCRTGRILEGFTPVVLTRICYIQELLLLFSYLFLLIGIFSIINSICVEC